MSQAATVAVIASAVAGAAAVAVAVAPDRGTWPLRAARGRRLGPVTRRRPALAASGLR